MAQLDQSGAPLPANAAQRLAQARAALAAVQVRVGVDGAGTVPQALPVGENVSQLFPGGLSRGTVASVRGSTSLILALAAEASNEGSWLAILGMPQVGVLAAARRGIVLERLALVPQPGIQAAEAVAACVEGMDLVLVGKDLPLSDAQRRRTTARVRERGAVLLTAGSWPTARVDLVVEAHRWVGLGAGDGRLREHHVQVAVQQRLGPVRRVQVCLEGEPGVWAPGMLQAPVAEEVA